MDLKAYFKSLDEKAVSPKTEFIERIMVECHVESKSTVYRWLNGSVVPGMLIQEKLSKITGIPVEKLFPKQKQA